VLLVHPGGHVSNQIKINSFISDNTVSVLSGLHVSNKTGTKQCRCNFVSVLFPIPFHIREPFIFGHANECASEPKTTLKQSESCSSVFYFSFVVSDMCESIK